MRSSLLMGSLLAGLGAILILPELSARPAKRNRKARASAVAPATESPAQAAAEPATPAAPAWSFPASLEPAAELARRSDWDQVLVALATVPQGDSRARALREVMTAEALLRTGEVEAAEAASREALDAAGSSHPALAARAAFVAGEARMALADPAAAAPLFEVAASSPLPALALEARIRRSEALRPIDPAAALGVVAGDAAAATAPPRVLALAGECAADAGRADEARALLERLHFAHPVSDEALRLRSHPLLAGAAERALRDGRAEALLSRADDLLEADRDDVAAADLAAAAKAGVPAPLQAELELLQGRLLRVKRQHAKALTHLARAAQSTTPAGCRAALHAAKSAQALRRSGEAAKWRTRAATGCPCEWRDRTAREMAADAAQDGRLDGAAAHWRVLAESAVTPALRQQAAWQVGWIALRRGRSDEALAAFGELVAGWPASREAAAARYWTARVLRDRGDSDGARQALASLAEDFPRDWYGLLAADETGAATPSLPTCASEDIAAGLRGSAERLLPGGAAGDLLDVEAMGLTEDALREADAAPGPDSDRAAFRALALSRAGRSREALREFRKSVPDWRRRSELPAALACAAWPLDHEDLLREAAGSAGLEPALVFGLVHQESVFDADAVSHAGARGLMQVMPATGQTIARWLGERVTTARLLDPKLNARYGTTYLRRLLDESSCEEVALAGYNAGPGRARRWWAACGEDVPLFVESIPFDETRDYVKAIAVNRRLYRERLVAADSGQ